MQSSWFQLDRWWELLDFGPDIDLSNLYMIFDEEDFPEADFKKLLSGADIETKNRTTLTICLYEVALPNFRRIFFAVLDAFEKADNHRDLFVFTSIDCPNNSETIPLVEHLVEEKVMELERLDVRAERFYFIKPHPKLANLSLMVVFGESRIRPQTGARCVDFLQILQE